MTRPDPLIDVARVREAIPTLLVANRGEIAVRIFRTCRALGIRTVAVYSEADARARHVAEADAAVCIGPARAAESYLDVDRVLAAAREAGAAAIHPGYGFLSENPEFARRVTEAGLRFVGPGHEAMATLGDKLASKALARQVGLPVASADDTPVADLPAAERAAEAVGYPVLLKPVAGGGGKGMRIARSPGDLAAELARCQDEARKAFGDDRVFVERLVDPARHIEFQVFADAHGNAVHFGERECSVQRRYQKVVEEAPSAALGPAQRDHMGHLACALLQRAGYVGAATVEFLLAPDSSFYFMEVNARLQVEHPVTEAITGIDLVALQLAVAAGDPLPLAQEDIALRGWAIEARLCAEDPARGFLPSTGIITRYAEPRGPGVRVDSGVGPGSVVGFHYDSLLAKIIAHGDSREQAIERLADALNGTLVEGLETNVNLLTAVVVHPAFRQGKLSTAFLDVHFPGGQSQVPPAPETLRDMAIAATLVHHNRQLLVRESLRPMATHVGGDPRPQERTAYVVKIGETVRDLVLEGQPLGQHWRVTFPADGSTCTVETPEFEFYQRRLRLRIDGRVARFRMRYRGLFIETGHDGVQETVEVYSPREWELAQYMPKPAAPAQESDLRCPMPGVVVDVLVAAGQEVYRRQPLVVIESMKMDSVIPSPRDGRVSEVRVQPGDTVEVGEVLVRF